MIWWDYGKGQLKDIIKNYGFEQYNREKKYKNRLQKDHTKQLNSNNPNPQIIEEIEHKIRTLELNDLEKARLKCHIKK